MASGYIEVEAAGLGAGALKGRLGVGSVLGVGASVATEVGVGLVVSGFCGWEGAISSGVKLLDIGCMTFIPLLGTSVVTCGNWAGLGLLLVASISDVGVWSGEVLLSIFLIFNNYLNITQVTLN